MPSIYTHNIFSKTVYKQFDNKTQKLIKSKKNIYEIFSQSFDFLYYYNFLSLLPGKKIRKLGRYCHRNNTQAYLINIIKYIKKNNLYKKSDILAYLYGSINHYSLDATMHPYINYLSEISKNKISMHTKIEFEIDAYYYETLTGEKFYKYDISNDLLKRATFSKRLKKCIDYAFKETYNINNLGDIYEKSYNQSRHIFNLAMRDPYGIKKALYKFFDIICVHFGFKCTYCSFYIKNINSSFLNTEQKEWFNPKNKKIKFNYSWNELMIQAEMKSLEIINLCQKYFKNQISLKTIKEAIPNISYANGMPLKN